MSEIVGEAVIKFRSDTTGVNPTKEGETAGKRFSGGVLNGTKRLAAGLAGAFAADKVVGFLKDAVGGASDLNETVSKTKVVFGPASQAVLDFANQGAAAFGQTKQQVLDAAGTFGTFGKAAGLQGKSLSGFSTQLTGLSSDLASFFNTDPSQAAEAIAAGLRGESEPLRAYGVLLNDTSLKAEAMTEGLLKPVKNHAAIQAAQLSVLNAQKAYNQAVSDSGKGSSDAFAAHVKLQTAQATLAKQVQGTIPPLTAQQKVLAAHGLILKQTKDAQGDFARTSGGLANQQRILSASFSDFRTKVGTYLLPIVLKVVKAMVSLFNGTSPLTPLLNNLKGALAAIAPVLKAAFSFIVANPKAFLVFAGIIGTLIAAIKVWTAVQWLLNAALDANPITLIVIALAALAAGLILAYQHSSKFRAVVDFLFKSVKALGSWIKGAFVATIRSIATAWDWVGKKITAFIAWLRGVPGKIGHALAGMWDSIKSTWTSVNAWLNGKINALLTWLAGLPARVGHVLHGLWQGAMDAWIAFGNWERGKIDTFIGFLANLPGRVAHATRGLFDGLKTAFRAAINWIIDKWNGLSFGLPSVNTHIPGVGTVGGFTLSTPDIPHLASGTRSFQGGLARVGEEGPENVWMPPGTRVWSARDTANGAGAGALMYVANQTVVAHDYHDFVAQSRRQSQQAAIGGRRGPR